MHTVTTQKGPALAALEINTFIQQWWINWSTVTM